MIRDAVDEGGELVRVAEHAAADGVEDFLQVRVDRVRAVVVVVAQVFHVFGQVAEEEDVGVTDFAGDLDLRKRIDSQQGWRYGSVAH